MKTLLSIITGSCLFSTVAFSQLPQKAQLSRYTSLWTQSPFTSKTLPTDSVPISNRLMDLYLLGVSPISGGYRVTLMEKSDPQKRITVDSNDVKSPFKILKVYRQPGNTLGTMVEMSAEGGSVMMTFNEAVFNSTGGSSPPNPASATHAQSTPIN